MTGAIEWIRGHERIVLGLGGMSVIALIGALLIVPLLIVRLPANYFVGTQRSEHRPPRRHPALRLAALIAKNLLGILLLIAGLAMLLLPGQGLLTLFVGMTLIDFPGKFRLEKRISRIPPVLKAMNWIRARHGQPAIRVGESP